MSQLAHRSRILLAATLLVASLALTTRAHAQDTPAPSPHQEALDRAQAHLGAWELDAAVAAFDEALAFEASFDAYIGRATARFYGDGNEEEASLEDFDAALKIEPDNTEAIIQRAVVYGLLGKVTKARRDLKRVLRDDPKNSDAIFAMVNVVCGNSRHLACIRVTTDALDLYPDNPELLYWRGVSSASIGDLDSARVDLLFIVDDEEQGPSTYEWLAEIELDSNNLSEARAWADRAVAAWPDDAYCHFIRSEVLMAQGFRGEAVTALARAATLDPDYLDFSVDDILYEDLTFDDYVALLTMFLVWGSVLGVIGLVLGGRGRKSLIPRGTGPVQPLYDGAWRDLLRIYIQNVVMTLLTLGVYRFWARVRNRRFHLQHTSFADGRFDYHATGREKFIGFLKGMAILLPFGAGFWFLDHWANDAYGVETAGLFTAWGFVLVLFLLRPLILVGSQRFNLARTSWSNLRFRFTGRVGEAYRLYLRDLVLIVITFGIYWPWHACRVREFRLHHTALGVKRFSFHGGGREFFSIALGGNFLSYITLGLYVPWYIAARHRFFINNTRFMGIRLKSNLTGGAVLAVGGPGFLISLLTLGFGIPWAITRWRTLLTHTARCARPIEADQLASIRDSAASSTIEGLGEAGDVLGEIGDLFGL